MSKKTYLLILKTGSCLGLLSVFLFFSGLLFPYITSKQIYFNILMEILFVFWVAFIFSYPEYRPFRLHKHRPKSSYLSFALIAFFLSLFLSAIFGVDFNLSFWGDVERMLGVFQLLHFLIFYFILTTAFRNWDDWRNIFIVSIIFAFFVSVRGIIDGQKYSTLGNTAYLSAYIIFNIYFSIFLFLKDKKKVFKWLYLIPIPFLLISFKVADTSGAQVGLGVSILAFFFLLGVLSKNKIIKKYFITIAVLLSVIVLLVFTNKDSELLKDVKILKQISFQKNTFQTRLISWKSAIYDFKNHPVLGTGYGNFAITFDKYIEPSFYSYTDSETYFDRAHNNLIDIMSTTGALGLLTYLSIFIVVFYYLIKSLKRGHIEVYEFVTLTSLIIAYFIQNLAVFDALVTYICLMIVLAYVNWLNMSDKTWFEKLGEKAEDIMKDLKNKKESKVNEVSIFAIFGVIMFLIMYNFNILPIKMLTATIDGQRAFASGDVPRATKIYKEALSYNTILDRDSRTSYIRSLGNNLNKLSAMDNSEANEIVDYGIELAKKNLEYNSDDSMSQMYLANVTDMGARLNIDNQEKFYYYSDQSLEAIDKSIEVSPGRMPLFYQKAQILMLRGEKEQAIEVLKHAIDLNPDYFKGYCNIARYYLSMDNEEDGFVNMDKCLDMNGVRTLGPIDFIGTLINAYTERGDDNRILALWERMSVLDKNNANVWVKLAVLYKEQGDKEKAIESAQKAGELDKNLLPMVDKFIQELE